MQFNILQEKIDAVKQKLPHKMDEILKFTSKEDIFEATPITGISD